ncbi:PH domain-containing protein [Camelliibacillus cellulosilyticus]|uniref:PH domain-containing protein n=1 Tax=Camelliibacillus cellulosilyticus TaxID=2174486 RepID=A0ABV9GMX2_9BACL
MNSSAESQMKARRMHPLWIVFKLASSIKEFLFPLVMAVILNGHSQGLLIKLGKIAILLFLVYEVVAVFLDWWHFKYLIADHKLHIQKGRFVKEKRTIPLDRIQSVNKRRSVFHRALGLAALTFETGAKGDEASVHLNVITLKEAERLQGCLSPSRNVPYENLKDAPADKLQVSDSLTHFLITSKEILLAALTSLSIFAFFPLIFALYDKINRFFSVDRYAEEAFAFFSHAWGGYVIIGLVALIVSLLFGIILMYVRYGNFKVASDLERIFVSKGVWSHSETSVPKDKVQAIIFKKNLIRRWFRFAKVELVCAMDGKDEGEETNVLFPFIAEERAVQLIQAILPTFEIETSVKPLPRAAVFAKLLRPVLFWLLVTAMLLYFWPQYWYGSLGLLAVLSVCQWFNYLNCGYAWCDPFIRLQSGIFTTELFITRVKKVEELAVVETWLQRRFGLASLRLSTRAKPVHVATVSDIQKETAAQYYHRYAHRKMAQEVGVLQDEKA